MHTFSVTHLKTHFSSNLYDSLQLISYHRPLCLQRTNGITDWLTDSLHLQYKYTYLIHWQFAYKTTKIRDDHSGLSMAQQEYGIIKMANKLLQICLALQIQWDLQLRLPVIVVATVSEPLHVVVVLTLNRLLQFCKFTLASHAEQTPDLSPLPGCLLIWCQSQSHSWSY